MGPKIFLSSVHQGFAELRDLVNTVAASIRLRGIDEAKVMRTETGGAAPLPPLEECLRRVRECHLVILLVGYRYGSPIVGDAAGRSYTEAEFDEALRHRKPLLVFMAKNRNLFRRNEIDSRPDRITAFRKRLEQLQEQGRYMLQYFESVAEFQAALARSLDAHLRPITQDIVVKVEAPAQNLRLPTVLLPPFDGIQDQELHGREDELQKLDGWYRDSARSALMIRAIGGMGKSSLAWRWLERLDDRCREVETAGKFWFSFYHTGHTIRQFLRELRDWLEPHIPLVHRRAGESDWTAIQRYLRHLKTKPLLILDGLEAEFSGYAGRRPHFDDDGSGLGGQFMSASAPPAADPEEGLLDRFADFRDEQGGRGLVDLIKSHLAKILITTRETPNSFVRASMGEQMLTGGLEEMILEELSPKSVRTLLKDFGISATPGTLDTLLRSPVIRHPLILVVFGRRVVNDDVASGNLEVFMERYPDAKLWTFAKHGEGRGRHHVLKFVFDDLTDIEKYIIDLITVADVPILSEFVIGAAEKEKGYSAEEITAAIDNLKYRRGIINAARRKAEDGDGYEVFYSMHPVCRMYWSRLNIKGLRESAERIDEEFEKHLFGGVGRGVVSPTVFDIDSRILPVTRVALTAARYERAWRMLEPFTQCYDTLGLYGTYYQILELFVTFTKTADGLVAQSLVPSKDASLVLFNASELHRLFGEHEKAVACAKALVDWVSREEASGPNEGDGPLFIGREAAEWMVVLTRIPTQDTQQNWRDITDLVASLFNRDVIAAGDRTIGEILSKAVEIFSLGDSRSLSLLNEFLIATSGRSFSFTSLTWLMTVRLDGRLSRAEAIEAEVQRFTLLYSTADLRSYRVIMLRVIMHLLSQERPEQARFLYDRIASLGGWDQLDLDDELEFARLGLQILEAETAGGIDEAFYFDLEAALSTYEFHFRSRFSRYDKLKLTVYRLRLDALAGNSSAHQHLQTATDGCDRLKLPQNDRTVQIVRRCAAALGRQQEVEVVLGALPERYDIPGILPDPIFGFIPETSRSAPRAWE